MAYEPKKKQEIPESGAKAKRRRRDEGNRPEKLARMCVIMAVVTVVAVGFSLYSLATSGQRFAILDGNTDKVVVATRDIQPGQAIDAGAVAVAEVPSTMAFAGSSDDAAAVVGHVALSHIGAGAVVDTANVAGDESQTLAGRVADGKLAISVSVTQQSGVAGLVRQGDHVTLYGDIGAGSEPIAESATVLAVDANLDASTSDYTALTVEVEPVEATRIALALDGGQVTFAIEPAEEPAE